MPKIIKFKHKNIESIEHSNYTGYYERQTVNITQSWVTIQLNGDITTHSYYENQHYFAQTGNCISILKDCQVRIDINTSIRRVSKLGDTQLLCTLYRDNISHILCHQYQSHPDLYWKPYNSNVMYELKQGDKLFVVVMGAQGEVELLETYISILLLRPIT